MTLIIDPQVQYVCKTQVKWSIESEHRKVWERCTVITTRHFTFPWFCVFCFSIFLKNLIVVLIHWRSFFQKLVFFVPWCKNVGGVKIDNGSALARRKGWLLWSHYNSHCIILILNSITSNKSFSIPKHVKIVVKLQIILKEMTEFLLTVKAWIQVSKSWFVIHDAVLFSTTEPCYHEPFHKKVKNERGC